MKGIVFSEFIEMVEDTFSYEVADHIVETADLPSGGVYTSLGTYDHTELLTLVTNLSQETGMAIPDLVKAFGKHLFGRFTVGYPQFFTDNLDAFNFLKNLEDYIHVEVLKLYPDAQLPTFEYVESPNGDCLEMIYKSSRPFATFAEGLLEGCIDHFQESIDLHCIDLSEGQGTSARFILTRRS